MTRAPFLTAAVLACALALAAPAFAAQPAAPFDSPGQRHANFCAHLLTIPASLRFMDASANGFTLDDQRAFDNGDCPNGTVRIDLHETIPEPSGTLVFHRGGQGYVDEQNVKYGDLLASDLVEGGALPAATAASGGRGVPCDLDTSAPPYRVDVESIPNDMKYKRPQDVAGGNNSGASFLHYGDPGADQGDRHDIHYSYLLWSFLDTRGGGHVRALLQPGQVVRPCDVDPIVMTSWDRSGNANGQVVARYVRAMAGTCPLYGWMVWSHTYGSGAAVQHSTPDPSAPADAGPPDPSCPVAPAGVPPDAVTGDAATAADGSWVIAGSINPHGVVTDYHFDYGPADSYGSTAGAAQIQSADAPVPVSASLGSVSPSTTVHYRLVATTTFGTSYGPDRTLTTPAPAPPPPAPVQPAAVQPPPPLPKMALSDLRVTPSPLRRARTRTGVTGRIRFAVNAPGKVALTFTRKTVGVRKGSACRSAPKHGIPRGARRCTRWESVPGSMRVKVTAGPVKLAFGGWIGHHALAGGTYRIKAVPTDSLGAVRHSTIASFRIR